MKVLAIISTKASLNVIRPEAEQFIAIHKSGVEVDIMCYPNTYYEERFREAGMKIVGPFPAHKNDKEAIKSIRRLLNQNNYDILHALHRISIACSIKAAKGIPVKLVAYRGASGIYWHDPTAYENVLNPRVDKVICVCREIQKNLSKQLFFNPKKAVTIYKGHKLSWYENIVKANRKTFGIQPEAMVVSWVANNRKWKDLGSFLKAIDLVPTNLPIYYILIGSGIGTPDIEKRINRNSNRDKVHLLGFRDDVLNLIAMSDVSMQTSYKNEGLSRSTIEAMSLGVTPVVTRTGGNDELVINGVNGLVVEKKDYKAMADAIVRLFQNPELNSKFAAESKKRIRDIFSLENSVNETLTFYRNLIDKT